MKTSPLMRFVVAVASFTMFVVVTAGGLCAAEIAAEIFCYRRELKMHGAESVVVCGDSRTERGLDPGIWSELFNFSLSGRPIDQTYLTPPWHPRLVRQTGREKIDDFTTVVSRYAARKGCRYLNALSMSFPDSYLMDENHLNSKGAVEFTRIARDWTRRLE